jgi:hypothetical protein
MRKGLKEIFQGTVLGIGAAFMLMGVGGAYIGIKEQRDLTTARNCAQQMDTGEGCSIRQGRALAKAFRGSRTEATGWAYLAFGAGTFVIGTSRRLRT